MCIPAIARMSRRRRISHLRFAILSTLLPQELALSHSTTGSRVAQFRRPPADFVNAAKLLMSMTFAAMADFVNAQKLILLVDFCAPQRGPAIFL